MSTSIDNRIVEMSAVALSAAIQQRALSCTEVLQAFSRTGTLQVIAVSGSHVASFAGIVVALLAKDNPLMVPLSACFIAYINTGANIMAMNSDVSSEMAQIIQGVIMLLIASGALLHRWRQKLVVEAAQKEQAQAAAAEAARA